MDKTYNIPATIAERKQLRKALKDFVRRQELCPPVSLKQLEDLADAFVAEGQCDGELRSWLMVEIHNQLWLPIVAGIPHERRLLMLPKCLSKHGSCQAEYDEFGLLCHRCGCCHIPSLQDKAELLGSLSIVAEGFTQVIELIKQNVVDAVIGVSCLDSLEKAFPLLVRHAVPGLAIALNDSGCQDTHVDEDYVEELLSMLDEEAATSLLDHDSIHEQVDTWFTRSQLEKMVMPEVPGGDLVRDVCLDWMCSDGKRWRPFLLVAVWQALTGKRFAAKGGEAIPEDVHRAAVAVECFHKASLIHDDIEDRDETRYGKPTVNALYGDAFAINAGDALLGEGYRILAQGSNPELLRLIADAHVRLCKGQGEEFLPQPAEESVERTLNIFRLKTAPAFEVSIMMGVSCAGNYQHLRPMLQAYSEALGIAYQLQDDLEDEVKDMGEKTELWRTLLAQYHQQALDALNEVKEMELKRLLYQITEKIIEPHPLKEPHPLTPSPKGEGEATA